MNSKIRHSRTYLDRRKNLASKRQIEHFVSSKEEWARHDRFIRVMPNTSAAVGQVASETYKADLSIDLKKHHAPMTFLDKMAYWTVKALRFPTDNKKGARILCFDEIQILSKVDNNIVFMNFQILSKADNNIVMEAVDPEVSVTCIDLFMLRMIWVELN
ncbi:hypothetical protein RIF29_15039 [Crotalaria pallida]|uniref:Uncharacterized protein n=1 Tax=Crotalaria pallida TaxID=3830 RepID=A0AAN9IIW4_CROPI